MMLNYFQENKTKDYLFTVGDSVFSRVGSESRKLLTIFLNAVEHWFPCSSIYPIRYYELSKM